LVRGYSEPVAVAEVYNHDPPELRNLKDRIEPILSEGIKLFKTGLLEDAFSKLQEAQSILPQDLPLHLLITSLRQTLGQGQKAKGVTLLDFR
jgi:hypothetical protein